VLEWISNVKGSYCYRETFVKAYVHYAKLYGIDFIKPKYRAERRIPRVPTTETVKALIANSSSRYAVIFKLLSETGSMPKELHNARLKDIDFDSGTLAIQGLKGHTSRIFKLKEETLAMLKSYTGMYASSPSLFPNSKAMLKAWVRVRELLATKLQDPKYHAVRLYDLRHYFACQLYARTKDILLVMKQLGHKKIETTLIYTQLIDFDNDEWICKAAKTVEEAKVLIESDFQYVATSPEGYMLFRKRK
jgi:integrase